MVARVTLRLLGPQAPNLERWVAGLNGPAIAAKRLLGPRAPNLEKWPAGLNKRAIAAKC